LQNYNIDPNHVGVERLHSFSFYSKPSDISDIEKHLYEQIY